MTAVTSCNYSGCRHYKIMTQTKHSVNSGKYSTAKQNLITLLFILMLKNITVIIKSLFFDVITKFVIPICMANIYLLSMAEVWQSKQNP